ncbi:MAG: hypothetical protein AAB463_02335 [Patescibacteria group bacterium]
MGASEESNAAALGEAVQQEYLRGTRAYQLARREELTLVAMAISWAADRFGENEDVALMHRRLEALWVIVSQCSVTGAAIPGDLVTLIQSRGAERVG